ncbi:hypothetical protein AN189_12360 [Loktanella sp. 3ANDIMAR09]|nr:hypothetical protein AN189_12360 [Loktanella sp. 3ANDIMAR09]
MAAVFLGLVACSPQEVPEFQAEQAIIAGALDPVAVRTSPLGVEDAVRIGIISSRNVQNSAIAIRQSNNEVIINRALYYPELYASASVSAGSTTPVGVEAGLRYTLFDFGERAAKVDGAIATVDQSRYALFTEIETSAEDILSDYIDFSIETAGLADARSYVDSIRLLEDGVRGRVLIGAASEVDTNDFDTSLIRATTEVGNAEAQTAAARNTLSSALGISVGSVLSPQQIYAQLQTRTGLIADDSLMAHPRYLARQSEIEIARAERNAVAAGLFPAIGVKLGIGGGLNTDGDFVNNGIVAGPSVSQSFPLGGGRKEAVANADLAIAIAEQNLTEELRLLKLEAQNARTAFVNSNQRVEQLKDVVNISIRTRDIMLGDYEVGNRALRDLLDAEERIYDARADLNEARRVNLQNLTRMIFAYDQASGKLYSAPE